MSDPKILKKMEQENQKYKPKPAVVAVYWILRLMITYYTDIRSQLLAQRVDERYIPIIEYAAQNGSINNSDVQNLLNTSKTTAYRILSQLDNWLEIQGTTGKGTHYTLKGFTKGS